MAAEIKKQLGHDVQLETGRRGSFEVTQDGKTIYSRLATGLFPNPEDVIENLIENVTENVKGSA